MASEFSKNAKNKAWSNYVEKSTSRAELSRVFFGKDPQNAFDKVKSGLQKELSSNSKKTNPKPVKKTEPNKPKTKNTKSDKSSLKK